ncbi:MAG TPA: CDC27 family protein [Aequorivita sp.]|nr:CDC27 family protein [Aequorivita sp.]
MEPNKKIESNQETQERIDAYLMGKLDEAALADFETQMRLFPDFRVNVNEQRILLKSVEEYNLKNSLEEYHTEIENVPEKKGINLGWLALAASFLVLLSVSTWAILNSGNSPEKVFAANFKPDPGLPTTMGTSSEYEFYYGMVNYKRKEYAEAISRWEPIYGANPENDTLVYFLGVANLANGNARQARKYLQMAKKKTESTFYEDAKYYLALSLLKENKIEEAMETLENSSSSANISLLQQLNDL